MKFKNNKIESVSTAVITLLRGEEEYPLLVSSHTKNLLEVWRSRGLVRPNPPKVAAKEGNEYIRDADGTIQYYSDTENPLFEEQFTTYMNRYAAIHVSDALRACDDLEFEAKPPTGSPSNEDWMEYLDKLHDEIYNEETGFSLREARQIQEVASALDGRFNVEGKLKDFLSKVLND